MAPKALADLLTGELNKPCPCPHCGKPSRPFTVQTTGARTLTVHIPPVNCCVKNRRGA